MSSVTKALGIIGEQTITLAFLKRGIPVSIPIGDNLPYDLVADVCGRLVRVQVKSTERITEDGVMLFETNITNPFKKIRRKYSKAEVDYFGLYCHENGFIGLVDIESCNLYELKIRVESAKNKQSKKVRNMRDYEFDNVIDNLLSAK